jgi:ABC-2 type transport system permease protein/oleandomycin transport system permease protein
MTRLRRPARLLAAVAGTIDAAGHNLRSLWRMPQALVFAIVQPVIFVLPLRYAFGRATHVAYADYLMPSIFAQAIAFGATGIDR